MSQIKETADAVVAAVTDLTGKVQPLTDAVASLDSKVDALIVAFQNAGSPPDMQEAIDELLQAKEAATAAAGTLQAAVDAVNTQAAEVDAANPPPPPQP